MKALEIHKLLQSKATVFTFKELILQAKGEPVDLLRRRLHYAVTKGTLLALRRGIYAKSSAYDRYELATKIFTPSYVSFETVLAQAGVIFQYATQIFVASYQSRVVTCDQREYVFKKLKDTILTNTTGNKGLLD